jgi:hypothetical protein
MTNPRATQWFVLVGVLLASGAEARAGEPDGNARSEAKEHLSRGQDLFKNGDNKGALVEFVRAYELDPGPLAIYHTALVHAAMGKSVEAVDALKKVLADPGPLKPKELARARATKKEQERRIGQLDVKVNVPATITIDGESAGEAPLKAPLRVSAGERTVAVEAPGYQPQNRAVTVEGAGSAEVAFELQPTEAGMAHVTVHSPLLGADVLVDEVVVGKTPLAAPLRVPPGKRVIELQRPGYMTATRTLTVAAGAYATVAFDPDEDVESGDPRGTLRLVPGEGKVYMTIDGRGRGYYKKPIGLPAGPHIVKLERDGYEDLEQQVDISGGEDFDLNLAWRPTSETVAEQVAEAQPYKTWGIVGLVTGAVVAGGSLALAVWSNSKLSTAESVLAQQQVETPNCDTLPSIDKQRECVKLLTGMQNDVDKYHDLRLGGIVGAVAGAAIIGVGVTLLILRPEPPHRAEPKKKLADSLVPVVSAGPDGASLLLRGRF